MAVLEKNGVLPKRTKDSLHHKFIQYVPGWQAIARPSTGSQHWHNQRHAKNPGLETLKYTSL